MRVLHPCSTLDFFDGSSMNGLCGSGMMVKLNESHWFNLWMGGGHGNNTKAELLGLWGAMFFANKCGIDSLNIYGDSKIIIEWAKGNYNLQINLLNSWCKRTRLLISEADMFSKIVVKEVFGTMFF